MALAPEWRVAGLALPMAGGVALAAVATGELGAARRGAARPGRGARRAVRDAYLLVDRLAPAGSGTRTFAWLVTANNGGLALGAAVAGAIVQRSGAAGGLWFGAACALAAFVPAVGAAVMSARGLARLPAAEDR